MYTLGLLVAIKLLIPNPHFPPVTVPQESPDMYNYLYGNITVAPSTKHVQVNLMNIISLCLNIFIDINNNSYTYIIIYLLNNNVVI